MSFGYICYNALQLIAIFMAYFMASKSVGTWCVQMVSKTKQNPTLKSVRSRLVSQTSCSIVKCLVY